MLGAAQRLEEAVARQHVHACMSGRFEGQQEYLRVGLEDRDGVDRRCRRCCFGAFSGESRREQHRICGLKELVNDGHLRQGVLDELDNLLVEP